MVGVNEAISNLTTHVASSNQYMDTFNQKYYSMETALTGKEQIGLRELF